MYFSRLFTRQPRSGKGQFSRSFHARAGFTMIELLVVSTIIIILTAIGLVSYRQVGQNARNGKRKADLETVRQALVLYRADNGTYPATTSFDTMLAGINNYISAVEVKDPKDDGSVGNQYVYTYTSDGSTFTLEAKLEPDAASYPLSNP